MKRNLLVFGMILSVGLITSCGDDDDGPTVSPIVGEWELDEATISGLPSEFSGGAGTDDNLYGESSYTMEFNADMTYEREVNDIPALNFADIDDEGEWEIDGDELELDPEEDFGLINDFEIINLTTDELELEGSRNFTFLPDAVADTAVVETSEELAALFDEFGQTLSVTVTLKMEKED